MAHLWIQNANGASAERSNETAPVPPGTDAGAGWTAVPLDDHAEGGLALETLVGSAARGARLITRSAEPQQPPEVLVAPLDGAVRVNGEPVVGMRALRDRDEILLEDDRRLFYGSESAATVAPFPGPKDARCPLCREEIDVGSPAVRCPGCGIRQHASQDRDCWGYRDTCTVCGHPTALDAEPRWNPEEL